MLEGECRRSHPDTDRDLVGLTVPDWPRIRDIAVHAAKISGLGYTGIDLVIDDAMGPAILEINARPGLDIQIANLRGLRGAIASTVARGHSAGAQLPQEGGHVGVAAVRVEQLGKT